ncbi:MAG: glycosyltransferase family 39 protein [bacterium]|nr:glycosyltransferase family 39 protein [bacterium]
MANSKNKIISFIGHHKFFISILLVATFLRFYHLGVASYWLDEGQSIQYVLNFKKYFKDYLAGIDSNHPPIYYMLLYFWTYLGVHEYIARSLSVIIGIITIIIVYQYVSKIFNKNTGLIAALLISLSTFHIQYCQELREYILLILFSLLGIFNFISYLQNNKSKYLAYFCIFSILGFWTHYFYIFTFAYLNIIFLFLFKRYNLKLKNWFLAQVIIFLAIIPIVILVLKTFFIPVAKGIIPPAGIEWLKPPNIYSIKDILISDLSSTNLLLYNENINPLFRKLAKLLFLVLFFLGVFSRNTKTNQKLNYPNICYLLFGYILFYIATVYLISIYFKPIFCGRYLIPLLPAYLIIITNGINSFKLPSLKYTAIIIVSIISFVSIYTYFTPKVFTKDQYRETALYIQNNEKEGDVICVNDSWVGVVFGFYYKNYYPNGTLNREYFGNPQNYNKLVSSLLKNYKRIWLVKSNTSDLDVNENVNIFIENNYPNLKKILELNFVLVNLYLYEVSGL